ncbi:MAG: PKD domain-containing protein, partial [Bacteroidota bacterium]
VIGGSPFNLSFDSCGITASRNIIATPPSMTINLLVCSNGVPGCTASFQGTPSGPLTYRFDPLISTYTSYSWDFGDGNTSNALRPSHVYSSAGTYTARLIVADIGSGCRDTSQQVITVSAPGPQVCDADFLSTVSLSNGLMSFQGIHIQPGNFAYSWDFGDGNTATTPVVNHFYAAIDTYDVCLYITDNTSACNDSFCTIILPPKNAPCSAFFFETQDPQDSLTFFFLPDSNFQSYQWDFGDGTTSSNVFASHTYASGGSYNVCLIVSDVGCSDTFCTTVNAAVNTRPCDASFTTRISPFLPLEVQFNASFPQGNMSWDFGDGNTATGANPYHIYAAPDTYQVCLTITDPGRNCTTTTCQQVIVANGNSGPNCTAAFYSFPLNPGNPLDVFFAALDSNLATYSWTLGDGTTKNTPTFSHTYASAGTYNVCLTVTDGAGCVDSICNAVVISGPPAPCSAQFFANPKNNGAPNTLEFVPANVNSNYTYNWDFGDGNTSAATIPTHTYASAGTYQVMLILNGNTPGCADTVIQSVSTVNTPPPSFLMLGQVFANNAPAQDITAYLIQYDSIAGTLTAIDTFVTDTAAPAGFFFLRAVPGSYLIKVALNPADPDYNSYLPTYYVQSSTFSNATMLSGSGFPFIRIDLLGGNNPGGPGFVGGLISQGAGKNGAGDPMAGMQAMIFDDLGNPIAAAMSNEDGEYEFPSLPYGNYEVMVELWGRTPEMFPVSLTSGSPTATNIDFKVHDTWIEALKTTTSVDDLLDVQSLRMYPNPANNAVNVAFTSNNTAKMQLQILDLSGKMIKRQQMEAGVGQVNATLTTSELPQGMYLLELTLDDRLVKAEKLIIVH